MDRSLAKTFLVFLALLVLILGWSAEGYAKYPDKTQKSETLRLLSLNLHGYHPRLEAPRFIEDSTGRLQQSPSHLHYFKSFEIERGHRRRVADLSLKLKNLNADLIFFQEVNAASPFDRNKNCQDFFNRKAHRSSFNNWQNSALQLSAALSSHETLLACRGNIGWQTDRNTFREQRVFRQLQNGKFELVFDRHENPYPFGVAIEGLAISYNQKRLRLLDHSTTYLEANRYRQKFFIQVAAFEYKDQVSGKSPWFLVANIHGGHKLSHFEEAVQVRRFLEEYINFIPRPSHLSRIIIAGDFNARLFRPHHDSGEISSSPWELRVEDQFDLLKSSQADFLFNELWNLNFDEGYKPWATVHDKQQVRNRIQDAISSLYQVFDQRSLKTKQSSTLKPLQEALYSARLQSPPCQQQGYCLPLEERIDFAFVDPALRVRRAKLLFNDYEWMNLNTYSDHPGLFAELEISLID